jgi:hypothetical protein
MNAQSGLGAASEIMAESWLFGGKRWTKKGKNSHSQNLQAVGKACWIGLSKEGG